jgi:hypothetical protein
VVHRELLGVVSAVLLVCHVMLPFRELLEFHSIGTSLAVQPPYWDSSLRSYSPECVEEVFCELLRLSRAPRNTAAEQGGSARQFSLCHNVCPTSPVRRVFKIPP